MWFRLTGDVSELFLEGVGGDGEDLDETHGDVQTSIRTIAARRLHHACDTITPGLYDEYEKDCDVDGEGGGYRQTTDVVVKG